MELEFLQGLRVGEEPLPQQVMEAILEKHRQELSQVRLAGALEGAVARAGGRSQKAIAALLDLESLREEKDVSGALDEALKGLKKEHGYLFESPKAPPYAPGTGTAAVQTAPAPATLAGALRERLNGK